MILFSFTAATRVRLPYGTPNFNSESSVFLTNPVDDKHLNHFEKVLEDVEKAGMKVETKHKDLGVATGSIDTDKVDLLRKVEGVDHVEEKDKFRFLHRKVMFNKVVFQRLCSSPVLPKKVFLV